MIKITVHENLKIPIHNTEEKTVFPRDQIRMISMIPRRFSSTRALSLSSELNSQHLLSLFFDTLRNPEGFCGTQIGHNYTVDLPKTTVVKPDMDICAICQQIPELEEQVYFLLCAHMFHCTCLDQWVKNGRSCPNCKMEFPYRD